jgi:hypothetical protein
VFTIDLTVACSLMSFSDDYGRSWITNPISCSRPVNDHQTLFGGPPVSSQPIGYENIVYYCYSDIWLTAACGKSLDGGLTWINGGTFYLSADGPTGAGPEGILDCTTELGHGVVGPDGTVYVPKQNCGEPWLAISDDEGSSWHQVRVSDRSVAYAPGDGLPDPSVAVDEAGNLYYVFVGDDRLPYLTYSTDKGESWSEPLMVAAPGLTETALATVDAAEPGKVAIAYYGTDDVTGPIDQRSYGNDVLWNGYITTTENVLATEPLFYSGNVNDPGDPLVIGECGPRRCFLGFDFLDVIFGVDGTPWASFTDSCAVACSGEERLGTGVIGHLAEGRDVRGAPSHPAPAP